MIIIWFDLISYHIIFLSFFHFTSIQFNSIQLCDLHALLLVSLSLGLCCKARGICKMASSETDPFSSSNPTASSENNSFSTFPLPSSENDVYSNSAASSDDLRSASPVCMHKFRLYETRSVTTLSFQFYLYIPFPHIHHTVHSYSFFLYPLTLHLSLVVLLTSNFVICFTFLSC